MSAKAPADDLAIVGGGISGLSTAWYAIEQGQSPSSVHIYESSARTGGKAQTQMLGDIACNGGPEFIDSTHSRMIALAEKLGVPLEKTSEQSTELFTKADGSMMSGEAFHAQYAPLHRAIIRLKQELSVAPSGKHAQMLNSISMQDLLTSLRESETIPPERNIFRRAWNTLRMKDNHVSHEIIDIAAHAYTSECGRAPSQISALQFINEVSPEEGSFLKSDCAYRVKSGMQQLVDKLREALEEKGVKFHTQQRVTAVAKNGDDLALTVAGENTREGYPVVHSKAIFALPAYALSQIGGLEQLGLMSSHQELIDSTQYADNLKFTIRTKPGVKLPQANFFSKDDFQCWNATPDTLTFLLNKGSKDETLSTLIKKTLVSYAKSNGMSAGDVFMPLNAENLVFTNPGKAPCYATPKPGQSMALQHMDYSLDHLAANHIGLAGSFLPLENNDKSLSFGFMEGGLASAERAVGLVVSKEQNREQWREQFVASGQERPAVALADRETSARR